MLVGDGRLHHGIVRGVRVDGAGPVLRVDARADDRTPQYEHQGKREDGVYRTVDENGKELRHGLCRMGCQKRGQVRLLRGGRERCAGHDATQREQQQRSHADKQDERKADALAEMVFERANSVPTTSAANALSR